MPDDIDFTAGRSAVRSNGMAAAPAPLRAGTEIDRARAEIIRSRLRLDRSLTELERRVSEGADWRHWVRAHPLACLAAGALLGYLVGRRSKPPPFRMS